MAKRIDKDKAALAGTAPVKPGKPFSLDDLPTGLKLPADEEKARLAEVQRRLQELQRAYLFSRDRGIVVFEGWDAAGKGGTIRRMTSTLDPRAYRVWPIAAPTEQEQGRHYLYRFWEKLPEPRTIAVFDRSWYGRVLVERVEGLAQKSEWRRAYDEINAFERMLTDDGVRMIKVFLHITQDEQRDRFKARLLDPMKRWKLSYEDFRNRARWSDYTKAIEDMIERTSTDHAPWVVVPANDKKYGRVTALETIVAALARGVDLSPRPLPPEIAEAARKELGVAVPDEAVGDDGVDMGALRR